MSLFFKNFSLVEVIYLLIRFDKSKFYPWNTHNTDGNRVNKQKTHTHAHQTLRKKKHPSPLFYQPLPFYGENLNSSLFVKILKAGGSNYDGNHLNNHDIQAQYTEGNTSKIS